MPKLLKDSKKAVQTRQRVRLLRGIRAIMNQNAPCDLLQVRKLKQNLSTENQSSQLKSSSNTIGDLANKLRAWAIQTNIKKRALTALLHILYDCGLKTLPLDSRSLLHTPRIVKIVESCGGKYWHNGLKNCLAEVFANLSANICIEINIHVDGLPLFKSSPITLWPILGNVHGKEHLILFKI